MMKQLITFLFVLVMVLSFSIQAQAELFNRGNDSLGNRLIYDSDLNITWYDYTRSEDYVAESMTWASGLTVISGGDIMMIGVFRQQWMAHMFVVMTAHHSRVTI